MSFHAYRRWSTPNRITSGEGSEGSTGPKGWGGIAWTGLTILLLSAFVFALPGSQAETPSSIIKPLKADFLTATAASGQPAYVPGEILVKFRSHVSSLSAQGFSEQIGAREVRAFSEIGVRHLKLPKDMTVEDAVQYYQSKPDVEFAEPNYLRYAAVVPNDTSFSNLWGLNNTGQLVNGTTGTADADVDAPEAWDITTGSSNVIIAVVDGGIAYDHPDLAANIWTNPGETAGDSIDNDGNGFVDDVRGWDFVTSDNDPMDVDGHGTHVAGTIAAVGNNSTGTTGVMWAAQLMPLRFLNAAGSGSVANAIAAINYAVAKGARIINGSYGSSSCSLSEHAAISAANTAGVLFVAAAGNTTANNDTTPHFPSGYSVSVPPLVCGSTQTTTLPALPNLISVAATTQTDALASFSNFGATSVQVAAPGRNIFSSRPTSALTAATMSENMDMGTVGSLPSGWTLGVVSGTNNTWALTNLASFSAPQSLTDSPSGSYLDDTDSFVRPMSSVSTVGQRGCRAFFRVRYDLETGFDFLLGEFSTNGTTWTTVRTLTGSSGGVFQSVPFDLPDGVSTVFLRARLVTDESITADGVYLDDLSAPQCTNGAPVATDLQFLNGTSMAAPHVSGIAGLLLARTSTLTVTQVRNAILNSVDVLPGLSGMVSTGGRVNAFATVASLVTALTCPSSVTPGGTGTCTVSISSVQTTDTAVPLGSSNTAMLTTPASVTVPASQNSATFTITGVANGTVTVTAGPLNGTSQTASVSVATPSSDNGGGPCFIATAAFGSPLAPEVQVLRKFRDGYLLTNGPGGLFVAAYYRVSPPLADLIREREGLKVATRVALLPVIWWAHLALASPALAFGLAGVGLLAIPLLPVLLRRTRRVRATSRGRRQEP